MVLEIKFFTAMNSNTFSILTDIRPLFQRVGDLPILMRSMANIDDEMVTLMRKFD